MGSLLQGLILIIVVPVSINNELDDLLDTVNIRFRCSISGYDNPPHWIFIDSDLH